MQLWALTVDSFRHARNRKLFWVLVAITLLVTLVMASLSFNGGRVSMLFGMIETDAGTYSPLTAVGRTHLAGTLVYYVMNIFLGRLGITLAIIATAGLLPAMMESGVVDTILSKPISRPKLFLFKYLSSMVFVLVQAALFVGLTFLVAGLRWGVWLPGYLLAIPLMVLLFSYIYCVSALVAVITRSAITAILLSMAAWAGFAIVSDAPTHFEFYPQLKQYETLYMAVRVASWIPPKTSAVTTLAARWAGAGTSLGVIPDSAKADLTAREREQWERGAEIEKRQQGVSPFYYIGTSLLFEAAIVGLAMWKFSRTDF